MTPTTRILEITAAASLALLLGAGTARAESATAPAGTKPAPAASDSSYTIKGGQERTDLKSLTVEGEDRVHVDIERPPLTLALDPSKVSGLVQGDARDVLDRVPRTSRPGTTPPRRPSARRTPAARGSGSSRAARSRASSRP